MSISRWGQDAVAPCPGAALLYGTLHPRRRVHISQSTMDCLKGEFEVEPGEGGSRCEYLKEKGIVTYLIVVPKQPLRNGINGVVSGGAGTGTTAAGVLGAPRATTFSLQKLSLTSSHGGSPLLINTKERNGSVSVACASPDESEEPDARARGTLESGEEDGEVRLRGSIPAGSSLAFWGDYHVDHTRWPQPLPVARLHFGGGYHVDHSSCASTFLLTLCFMAQAVNPSFPNPRRRLRLRDLAERVIDASQNEQELNKLLNEALLERESVQA